MGGAQISIDKRYGARMAGLGRRKRVFHLPPGSYPSVVDVSWRRKVYRVFDETIDLAPGDVVRVQVVGGYRRFTFGASVAPEAWRMDRYQLPTWWPPRRIRR